MLSETKRNELSEALHNTQVLGDGGNPLLGNGTSYKPYIRNIQKDFKEFRIGVVEKEIGGFNPEQQNMLKQLFINGSEDDIQKAMQQDTTAPGEPTAQQIQIVHKAVKDAENTRLEEYKARFNAAHAEGSGMPELKSDELMAAGTHAVTSGFFSGNLLTGAWEGLLGLGSKLFSAFPAVTNFTSKVSTYIGGKISELMASKNDEGQSVDKDGHVIEPMTWERAGELSSLHRQAGRFKEPFGLDNKQALAMAEATDADADNLLSEIKQITAPSTKLQQTDPSKAANAPEQGAPTAPAAAPTTDTQTVSTSGPPPLQTNEGVTTPMPESDTLQPWSTQLPGGTSYFDWAGPVESITGSHTLAVAHQQSNMSWESLAALGGDLSPTPLNENKFLDANELKELDKDQNNMLSRNEIPEHMQAQFDEMLKKQPKGSDGNNPTELDLGNLPPNGIPLDQLKLEQSQLASK